MRALVVDGRSVSESGVPAMWVVPALDPFEDRHPGFRLRPESATAQQLSLAPEGVASRSCEAANLRQQGTDPECRRRAMVTDKPSLRRPSATFGGRPRDVGRNRRGRAAPVTWLVRHPVTKLREAIRTPSRRESAAATSCPLGTLRQSHVEPAASLRLPRGLLWWPTPPIHRSWSPASGTRAARGPEDRR